MFHAGIPPVDECRRVAVVTEMALMNNARNQEAYDRIAHLAKRVFGTEIVLITFIDANTLWCKAALGLDVVSYPREGTFCTHVVASSEILVVEDALKDPRFERNPYVLGEPHVRFYAGHPLVTHDGHVIGTMCLVDPSPRTFSADDLATLADLAALVMTQVSVDNDLTYRDATTRLPNRIQLFADLQSHAARFPGVERSVAAVELMGLLESNEAIRAVGINYLYDQMAHAVDVLRQVLPPGTVIYHIGPTHLAFCLEEHENELATLDRVEHALRAPFITPLGIPSNLEPGCGLRRFTTAELATPDTHRTLLQTAREARLSARGVAIYDPEHDAADQRAFFLILDLPRAIADGELSLVFQPKVASFGGCAGVEALLRWHHREFGFISPGEFLPHVDKTGLIREVTDWVMHAVCRQLAQWRRQGLDLHCSFNVSVKNLNERDFADRLQNTAQAVGVPLNRLGIEVVEDVMLLCNGEVTTTLHNLRDFGVTIAIDDFGTGYSNISYLLQTPISVIKIDKSLIVGVVDDPTYATVVAGVVQVAHQLGFRVVAEGVETPQVDAAIRSFGCDELQGYYHAKPMPADEVLAWCRAHQG